MESTTNGFIYNAHCPHCHKEVEIRLGVKMISISPSDGQGALPTPKQPKPSAKREALTDAQRQFLDVSRTNGMVHAFSEAVANGPMAEHAPKDMELFYLHVMQTCKQKVIPRNALDILINSLGGPNAGLLEFFTSNGVGVVTLDRRIRAFVPVQFAVGESVRNASGTIKFRTDNPEDLLRNWVKTRMGYVPVGATAFIDSVRKRSIGDFAKPVL